MIMTNDNYSKLVERYLEGEMSGSEALEFEQLMTKDPILASEYNFQNEIVSGIKDYRKAELKMRLDNVDVTPGLFESLVSNTAAQLTGGVILTGAIGFGAFLYMNSSESIETIDLDILAKESRLGNSEFIDSKIEEIPLLKLKEFNTSNRSEEINTLTVEDEVSETAGAEPLIITPNIVSPTLADSGDSEEILPVVEGIEGVVRNANAKDEQIEIESSLTSKQFFQYKFYNNKLFLFGDFKGIPYEILEINGTAGKKIFLYHNNVFYRIHDNVTKTSRLRKVNDQKLIDELMILKENKTQQ